LALTKLAYGEKHTKGQNDTASDKFSPRFIVLEGIGIIKGFAQEVHSDSNMIGVHVVDFY
jgi:hypothetical protein